MRGKHFCWLLVPFFLLLLSLASAATATAAQVGTRMELRLAESAELGDRPLATVLLLGPAGEPGANFRLLMMIDGVVVDEVFTDATGTARWRLPQRTTAGTFQIAAVFGGKRDWESASAKSTLRVRPAILEVQTVPPLKGVAFTLDGRRFESDADGSARVEVMGQGTFELALESPELQDGGQTARFRRWFDSTFTPDRTVTITGDRQLEVGFELSFRAYFRFTNVDAEPVPLDRIESMVFRNNRGEVFTIDSEWPTSLPAVEVIARLDGLEPTPFVYVLDEVLIDGSNVVNRGQQRFTLDADGEVPIDLLLFDMDISARDALFGFPIGRGVTVVYPDGKEQYYPFDEEEQVRLMDLARGLYRVQVVGASGIAPPTPVALSRHNDVSLLVLSYLDLGVMLGLGALLALGLLFLGRPLLFIRLWRLSWLRRPEGREAPREPDPGLQESTSNSLY